MGLFSKSDKDNEIYTAVLDPVSPPVGIFPDHYAEKPTTLLMRDKTWAMRTRNFSVTDTDGHEIVHCEGKAFSIRCKKVITDGHGNELLYLRNKAMSSTMIAEDAAGNEVVEVRERCAWKSTDMTATFRDAATQQAMAIDLHGGCAANDALLTLHGQTIATIRRDKEHLSTTDKHAFAVNVAPGVDLALLAIICMAFDEVRYNKNVVVPAAVVS